MPDDEQGGTKSAATGIIFAPQRLRRKASFSVQSGVRQCFNLFFLFLSGM